MSGHFASANKSTNKKVLVHPEAKKAIPASTNSDVLAPPKSWREKNRAAYNAKQKEIMRERRRKLKYDSEEEGT